MYIVGTVTWKCNRASSYGTLLVLPTTQKAPVIANEGFAYLVARGGIEPPTQGFSILCSTD